MVESSRKNSQNVESIRENSDIEMLYNGEDAEGFDISNGSEWIYPTNYPVRTYQKNIVSNALFKNTLVCLPTGLGKTFIAAVVMYNYHRWYPKHIVVFMAHSKPLVTQQVNACCNIMGISPSLIAELNGNMQHSVRKKQWESKKIFFLTPQVFNNDLARGNVKAESIRCIVIDEAHKALGNQAYCQVIRSIKPFNTNFRVLALSATPGDDMNMVKEVIQNLMISHLELRNEEDPDIKPYLHEKKIETVIIKLDQEILNVKEMFLRAVDKYIKPLAQYKLIPQSYSSINSFTLVLRQRQFTQDSNIRPELRGLMLSNFSVAISLFHALEELVIHGMRSFVTKLKSLITGEGATNKVHHRIANDDDFKSLIEHVENKLGPDNCISFDGDTSLTRIFDEIDCIQTSTNVVYSHPKFAVLEKIIQEHFESHKDSTRVIVFCKSRQCTGEICNFLARFKPIVKPMIFIGQSQSSGGIVTKGFNQAAQLTVMKKFRDGVYNTLIATCVAEEGLDIGEVDLIVNFDSGKNSNTQVQRCGRTGRKRDGRVVNLVTEGKEHQNYNISVSKGKKMSKKLVSIGNNLPFYLGSPRLIPNGITPVCQEMYFTGKTISEEEPKVKKRKGKGTKKKQDDEEEGQASKRMKESTSEGKKVGSLWTMIADEKAKRTEKVESEVGERNPNEESAAVNVDNVIADRQEAPPDNEVEIVEVEVDRQKLLLYDDEGSETEVEPSESSSEDETEDEEEDFEEELSEEDDIESKPKSNFRGLLDLNKISKYCNISETNGSLYFSKMQTFEDCILTDEDKLDLMSDKMEIETFVTYFEKLWKNLVIEEVADTRSANKTDEKPAEVNVALDIDPDEFFHPFEDVLPSPKPQMMSSTPVRGITENKMPPPVRKSPVPEPNFHLWDESDFFNQKENLSPKRDGNVSDRTRNSSCKKKEVSMISITQALDIVNNSESVKSDLVNQGKGKENGVCESPASPILFCSQKPKTRNKLLSNSPILTQGRRSATTSRKCLTFSVEPGAVSAEKTVQKFTFEDLDNSDLFAETEVALQNHLQELEENLHEIEKQEMEKKNAEKQAVVRGLTAYSSSSENTVEYDLGHMEFDENSMPASLSKTGNKTSVETTKLDKEASPKSPNVSNFREEKENDESRLSRLDFSSFFKSDANEVRPVMESTPIRPSPKLAVIRPLGFDNTMANTSAVNPAKSENKTAAKEELQSFACNFSLFGDDDFGEECFNIEQIEKAEKTKISEKSAGKVDGEGNEGSNDSDIFVNRDSKQKSRLSPKDKRDSDAELFKNMLDDGDLSEGAMEAIKAVEMYENDAKLARKAELIELDSDDSDDFFVPARKQTKLESTELSGVEPVKPIKKKKDKNKENLASEFVEKEADVSDTASSDENTSGLDEYDSSFVDEREVLTQAQDVDMTAKYLQWTKSAAARPGTFKIPNTKIMQRMNVFSQIGSEGESEYENDSFCVSDVESENEVNEISQLEMAEIILRDKKKRKRLKEETVPSVRKKKFKRVLRIESDSSDDDVVEIVPEASTRQSETSDIQELFRSPFPHEKSTIAASNTFKNHPKPTQDVMFIASRQIASAPEITTCLRARWNVNVQVRSAPEADYIVSWRVGINRISLSDFVNGSPAAKSSLKEMVEKLSAYFHQPVLIVEDDKNKGLPLTVGCHKVMWARHSMKTLIKVLQSNVRLVFSRNKDDTARILVLICKQEKSKGHYIHLNGDLHPETERKMKFYGSLPGVNVANAFRMASKFLSISSFMNCCDSVHNIKREMGLSNETASSVYQWIYTTPS